MMPSLLVAGSAVTIPGGWCSVSGVSFPDLSILPKSTTIINIFSPFLTLSGIIMGMNGGHMSEQKTIGISDAARRLGVHHNTLRKWVDRGIIPALRLPSGHRRFDVVELERFRQAMATRPHDGRQKAPDQPEPVEGETPDTGYSR
jgi:excisionase family DNA binding protein